MKPTAIDTYLADVDVDIMVSGLGSFFACPRKGHCRGSVRPEASLASDTLHRAYVLKPYSDLPWLKVALPVDPTCVRRFCPFGVN